MYQQQLALSFVLDELMKKMERTNTRFWKFTQTDRMIVQTEALTEPHFGHLKTVLLILKANIKMLNLTTKISNKYKNQPVINKAKSLYPTVCFMFCI